MAMLGCGVGFLVEFITWATRDTVTRVECLVQTSSDRPFTTEWLAWWLQHVPVPAEFGALVARDAAAGTEWLGATVVPFITDSLLSIEWSALPDPVLVSLSTTGKRRLLATPGRLRILKRL
jgi:hypothetical protein